MLNLSSLKIKIRTFVEHALGNTRANRLLNKYYLRIYRKNKIIFVHIPRAAGTSIACAIYGKRNGHLKAAYIKSKMGSDFNEKYSFSVTRNPYRRLASAYRFVTQGKTQHGAITNPGFYQQPVFNSFSSFVKEWLVNQRLTQIDLVFQPQHTFVFENGACLVDDLFKLENLSVLENRLSSILNEKITIGVKNKTMYKSGKQNFYNSELRETVYELYKKDFELLNYDNKIDFC